MSNLEALGNLPAKLGENAAAWSDYWLSLPKHDGVPLKRALDPAAMRRFVASLVIVEHHAEHRYTWRLMGTAVRNITGIEMTGTDALKFHSPGQREKALVAYGAQLDTPCGAWGITMFRGAVGYEIPVEVLVLPMRDDDGTRRFLVNTVERLVDGRRLDSAATSDVQLLSWPEHRFVDIGFGLPKLRRRPGAQP